MNLVSLFATLFVGFAVSTVNAQVPAGQELPLRGYSAGCALAKIKGMPILKIALFSSKAEAVASATSPKLPQVEVVLDFGPGIMLSQANPDSTVRAICAAISAQRSENPISVRANAQGIVELVGVHGKVVASDSFALMPPNAQKTIMELVDALMKLHQRQQQEEQQEEEAPERPPLTA